MSISRTVTEVLREHVTLEVEGIDRMYLNVYVPALQRAGGVASFFRFHRGHQFASSVLMDPITKAFIAQMEQFAKREKVPVVLFEKGQRKDDVAAAYRKKFAAQEGVLFIGKAQEKTTVFRTERRRNDQTGATYPGWAGTSVLWLQAPVPACVSTCTGLRAAFHAISCGSWRTPRSSYPRHRSCCPDSWIGPPCKPSFRHPGALERILASPDCSSERAHHWR